MRGEPPDDSPAMISLGKGTLGKNSLVGVEGEVTGELALELSSAGCTWS